MTKNLEQKIADLREALQTSEDFSETVQKFFALSELKEFHDLSVITENEIVEALVNKVVEQAITSPNKKVLLRLVCLEKFGFYHGSMLIGKRPGMVFYFEGIGMGMVVIPINSKGEVSYFRLTADIFMEDNFPGKTSSFQND